MLRSLSSSLIRSSRFANSASPFRSISTPSRIPLIPFKSPLSSSASALSAAARFRSFSTAPPSASAPIHATSTNSTHDFQGYQTRELTEQEKQNQKDWADWEEAKINGFLIGLTFAGYLTVVYWYRKEIDHFYHHRFEHPAYAYFIDRSGSVAGGWWPGRHCQFFEFNCFSMAYDAADKLLEEKRTGKKHDDKHGEEHEEDEEHEEEHEDAEHHEEEAEH